MEVYMDDMLIMTIKAKNHLQQLSETFFILRR